MQNKKILIAFFLWVCALTSLTSAHTKEKNTDKPVFAKNGNIFLKVNGQLTQLTNTGRDFGPVLSPDDRLVAFTRTIEGKFDCTQEELSQMKCASYQLWVMDIETRSEQMLLEPQIEGNDMEKVISEFTTVIFSPDSKTVYICTATWADSGGFVHAVDIDGSNKRLITPGYLRYVVNEPLRKEFKEYIADVLKEDDLRITPKGIGVSLMIPKALNDDVIGYLIVGRSRPKKISAKTPFKGAWRDDKNGEYYKWVGKEWTELVSLDGSSRIPIANLGSDSYPVLSPDSRIVVFIRETADKPECTPEQIISIKCANAQLWVKDIETRSERMLVAPRIEGNDMEKIIFEFDKVMFSPDSKTVYFSTATGVSSGGFVHAIDINGSNERFVTPGNLLHVINKSLSKDYKKYIATVLKKDDLRIYPKKAGALLISKALKDDVKGYLIVKRGDIRKIISKTHFKNAKRDKDGTYYKSIRKEWAELVSPDGRLKIPIRDYD